MTTEHQSPGGPVLDQCRQNGESLYLLHEKMQYLQDLFLRRLQEDKQKTEMIRQLEGLASFAVLEPFLSDLLLLLDRVSTGGDEVSRSVADELGDILARRGVQPIPAKGPFDPAVHKAVRLCFDDSLPGPAVKEIIRTGYALNGRVLRPAEVVVAKPHPEGPLPENKKNGGNKS